MKIAIEATLCAAQNQATGLGVYTNQLLKHLPQVLEDEDHIYLLHSQKKWHGVDYGKQFEPVSYYLCPSQFVSINLSLRKILKKLKPDIFHITCNAGSPPVSPVPVVTTVHDLFSLTSPGVPWKTRILMKLLFAQTVKNTSAFISNSEYTRQTMISYGIDAGKITPVYPGTQMDFSSEILLKKPTEHPYFLCVGALEYRKGQLMLAKAYLDALRTAPALPDLYFIGSDRSSGAEILKMAAENPKLKYLNFVSKEDLCSYYQHASAFLFPSYEEGFGIPVVEALKAGLPVICSDIPVLREVAAGGACFVKPETNAFKEILLQYANSKIIFPDHKNYQPIISRFDWLENARQTMLIYKKTAGIS